MPTGHTSKLLVMGRAAIAALALAGCADKITDPNPPAALSGRVGAAIAQDASPSSIVWQQQAGALIGANNMSPLAASRIFGALSVAQYRAVLAADSDGDNSGRSGIEARRGAVAGASAQVLTFFFAGAASNLEGLVTAAGNAGGGGVHPQFARGLALGREIGTDQVNRTRADRFTAPWTGSVPTGAGKWIANGPPAGATFGGIRPYLLTSGDQFRPGNPPAFGSTAFNTDLAEIATLATNRTDAQRALAVFWNFGTGSFTPIGYWNEIVADYITAVRMDERGATHAFALTHAAVMDAMIGCWDAKYHHWTLRPSQANAGITLSLGLPNHPSYPSGHSCASAAAATVLANLFPARTAELDGMVAEAGLSRMYAGIHYRFDITAGQDLGRSVALWAIARDQEGALAR
jgi:membrane-associated phospholipid phosphatase